MNALTPAPLIRDVAFKDLRIPYLPETEVFGIDNVGWKVLIDSVFPAARSLDAIMMALAYCHKRKLDVFKKVVHIVPMWSTARNAMIETVWPGIAELRTTACRTGEYAGCDEAEFGREITTIFEGTPSRGRDRTPRREEVTYPEWCRVTSYKIVHGQRCRFVGPKVYWKEAYARVADTAVPNDMWCKRSIGQLEKCAEAASLRRAFPEELGNEYAAEEMEGHVAGPQIGGFVVDEARRPMEVPPPEAWKGDYIEGQAEERPKPPRPPKAPAPPPPAKAEGPSEAARGDAMQRGYDDRTAFPDLARDSVPPEWRNEPKLAEAWQEGFDRAGHAEPDGDDEPLVGVLARFEKLAAEAEHEDELADVWGSVVRPQYRSLTKEEKHRATELYHHYQEALRGG